MSAKEMFKELGYEVLREDEYGIDYLNRKENYSGVCFCKGVYCASDLDGGFDFNMELHKAIHQQLKELNWI